MATPKLQVDRPMEIDPWKMADDDRSAETGPPFHL
jgi:hypothetical protein